MTILENIKYYSIECLRYIYYILWKVAHFWMYFNPKNYIPEDTMYCYTYANTFVDKNCKYSFRRLNCKFHKFGNKQNDLCMYDNGDCISDYCKTCGINMDEDYYD